VKLIPALFESDNSFSESDIIINHDDNDANTLNNKLDSICNDESKMNQLD